ncbi:MAG TPA: CBASS cGAMP-activated phospholipase [Candidatus Nitrosotenuis sp.]|jgi:patatin-like phospholipase/acyl hydrolase|nr:CBASS cGAMP-activated phospholipase [Candidatus Nitrosotenuis sp.]
MFYRQKLIPVYLLVTTIFMITLSDSMDWEGGSSLVDNPPQPKHIVSFDGGGIRGLLSTRIVQKIEDELGDSITNVANCFAGTSTGGLIALGYASGYKTDEIIDLFINKKDEVFSRSPWRKLKSVFGLTDEKYDTQPFERLIKSYYGEQTTLRDLKPNVIVPGTNITKGEALIFDSYLAKRNVDHNYPIWQIARATSAAPTYFEPMEIHGDAIVDGGLIANNPSTVAMARIKQYFGCEALKELKVISVGTGNYHDGIPYSKAKNMGILEWASPISSQMMSASSKLFDSLTQDLMNSPQQYIRLNQELVEDIKLDDIQPENIQKIEDMAEEFIKNNPDKIETAVNLLRD